MPRKLFDIEVDEITLCPSTANRKKFAIKKKEKIMEEFIDVLKSFLADEDEDEAELTEEEIAKAEKLSDKAIKAIKGALNILNKYKADMPDDVLSAIKTLAKYAGYGYPAAKADDTKVDKAGAKLSKTTRDQLAKILDFIKESPKAIAAIKTLLGQPVQKDDDKTDDKPAIPADIQERLDKLEKLEKDEEDRIEKEKKEKLEKEEKEKEELLKRVEKLEKKKGVKKSIDGQDDDDQDADDDDEEDNFPSIPIPTKD